MATKDVQLGRYIKLVLTPIMLCSLLTSFIITADMTADFETAAGLYRQRNYNKAFETFVTLSEAGNPRAKTVLAMMYKYGEGSPQDMSKALFWYESAAEQGYALAQFHAGTMYAAGLGTEPDPDRALYWLTLASDQGFDAASNKLDELSDELIIARRDPDEVVAWSKDWDFRLPNALQFPRSNKDSTLKAEYRVQVGAMGSYNSAVNLWKLLRETHPDLFSRLVPRITLSENTARQIYRVQAGPFSNRDDASRFCEQLLNHPVQAGCLPVKVSEPEQP